MFDLLSQVRVLPLSRLSAAVVEHCSNTKLAEENTLLHCTM